MTEPDDIGIYDIMAVIEFFIGMAANYIFEIQSQTFPKLIQHTKNT